ncbi:prolyl-tRNA synthetase [Candidatus Kaiserbacteria bacterium RIFCSPHIGHO2_02_FULL_55_25]|uniref:Proline--tRNA ligase n=1 Tax=Candidatus Kaiserbacteria bacterium RIFCSPHIGHO2_02_FULL_55_25 TaxID=1798498 RepID=A0A1F6E5Z4_9BACT|nr:MAG: prolyl-tRNA synthetase [Candidatus Kaiserbacteria bacterium RIFCSPHIGHO2_02_FULL_55_25]OGG84133.1 MAG: prolyl-tRNA synthetase [Candidatus Kaiserbacteria bacterium RIFCSPLOWO2_01_FULL_55_25]
MRQSQLFTKTRKSAPKDEVAKNAQLLIRGGFIHKEMAGVYSYLPLGLRVLKNIENIIREEMNGIGGQEILMTALQDSEIWKTTGRWSDDVVDNWFKTKLTEDSELGLAHSHEEPLVRIMRGQVSSYRDFPRAVYQIQTKFRRELRAKSGILRGREFIMKDMYSFVRTQEELDEFHEKAAEAYMRIFARAGLGERTFRTFAAGGSFSKFSDEFQTLCDAGEDTLYLDRAKKLAVNREVYTDDVLSELRLKKSDMEEVKAIEVGNIFKLGTRFSQPLGLTYKDENGKDREVLMGCYGIGLGRLMGTIVEALSDEKGIVWPKEVAPFQAHLVAITGGNADVAAEADRMYELLREHNIEVLYDDRDIRAGEKFADAELIGIPVRLVISEKTLSQGGLEVSERSSGNATFVSDSDIVERLKN